MTGGTDRPEPETSPQAVTTTAEAAARAAARWATSSPLPRARALLAVAEALAAAELELVPLAIEETGLTEGRLATELERTILQWRLFADIVVEGSYLDVRIDEADPGFVLGPRPDVRRYLVPVGPVLNFAAGNFPFAFSVAGGDTVSALAAGSPVIVKAHPGHPRLSSRTGQIVAEALQSLGAPEGTLALIFGTEPGVQMLRNPRIAAASFTGSQRAGQLLAQIAAARPRPIPFFGELGSVNPVFVTAQALHEREKSLAAGFAASVCLSAGQLCTKPGLIFVPRGSTFAPRAAAEMREWPEHRLLSADITDGFIRRRDAILAVPGVEVVLDGELRVEDGVGSATLTLISVGLGTLRAHRRDLVPEVFGPLSIVVEYDDAAALPTVVTELLAGELTATVHTGDDEQSPASLELARVLADHAGRVLFNGWPTGVAVTPAMQHGGPWPATTSDSSTSVGTAAITRFLRAVAYQDAPVAQLPPPLRDDNPWQVPQRRSARGESANWGARASRPR